MQGQAAQARRVEAGKDKKKKMESVFAEEGCARRVLVLTLFTASCMNIC